MRLGVCMVSVMIAAGVAGVLVGIVVTVLAVSAVERWGERRPEYLQVRDRPIFERKEDDGDGNV